MDLIVGGQSDVGIVRAENEDALIIHEPTDPEVRESKGLLMVLADGMGGLEDGSTASRIAVEAVVRHYYESLEGPRTALENAAHEANRAIYDHSQRFASRRMMGSTLTAAAILEGHAWVAQVGDSRAYRYREGILEQVTKDHSLVRELVDTGKLEEASPTYAYHRHVLTRGLGLQETVIVDLYELSDLESGDRLLLTSDGLHELVKPEEMSAILERNGTGVDATCRELVELARSRGGPDNITVAIACVEGKKGEPRGPMDGTRIRKPTRTMLQAGWLLPFVILGSFASGVGLTLLVQTSGFHGPLRAKVDAALESASEATRALDSPQSKARIQAELERVQKLLDGIEE